RRRSHFACGRSRARRLVRGAEVSAMECLLAALAGGYTIRSSKCARRCRDAIVYDVRSARGAVVTPWRHICRGGIYDHLGGGFARYSVDEFWLVPHFEKMLYDNALLIRPYLHAWQLTGDAAYRRVLDETIGYLLRDLRSPGGGFYSA